MALIPCAELTIKVGDRLDHAVVDRSGQILLQRGKIVASSAVVARLVERGFMRIGEESAPASPDAAEDPAGEAEGPAAAAKTAQGKLVILAEQLNRVLHNAIGQSPIAVDGDVLTLAGWANGIYARDNDQLLGVQQLLGADDGSIEGAAIHGAILVRLLSAHHGLDARVQLSLMAAALTRHVGLVGDELKPLPAEVGQRSAEILKNAGVYDRHWLDAVRLHQARLDGSAYPEGLAGDAVPPGARIVGLVDAYLAATRSSGNGASPLRPRDALRDLYAAQGDGLDARLTQTLIKLLGIYPPGSVLKLANGEIAVSTRRTGDPKRPIVRAAIGADGLPFAAPPLRDIQTANHRIVEVLDASRYKALVSMASSLWRRDIEILNDGVAETA